MRYRLRLLAAATLLVVMCLGSVCHFWHHLSDPACAGGRIGSPCATCSGLHGGAVATSPGTHFAPTPAAVAEITPPAVEIPIAPVLPTGAPRGPPTA